MREWADDPCSVLHRCGMGWGKGDAGVWGIWLTCPNHSYPPKMIPPIDIMVCTTATNDRDARLLLSSMGVPFYGKHAN